MKTTLAKTGQVERNWYIVDADGEILGRLAVKIANVLRGRHKATFTPHVDTGDYVVVINADKVRLTGKKEEQKNYMFYSGWFGNEKYVGVSDFRQRRPEFIVENAVRGMLPRNRLARQMMKKLRVYGGAEHPHTERELTPLK